MVSFMPFPEEKLMATQSDITRSVWIGYRRLSAAQLAGVDRTINTGVPIAEDVKWVYDTRVDHPPFIAGPQVTYTQENEIVQRLYIDFSTSAKGPAPSVAEFLRIIKGLRDNRHVRESEFLEDSRASLALDTIRHGTVNFDHADYISFLMVAANTILLNQSLRMKTVIRAADSDTLMSRCKLLIIEVEEIHYGSASRRDHSL